MGFFWGFLSWQVRRLPFRLLRRQGEQNRQGSDGGACPGDEGGTEAESETWREAFLGQAYVGIPGNERADERAKFFTKVLGSEVLTEGGIIQQLAVRRKVEYAQVGWGGGRVAR